MALFKKNDKQTIAELESYYAGQNQTRTGMAWIMAFLSLFITVAVLSGLFFGGRWIYRSLTNNDTGAPVEVADLPETTPLVENGQDGQNSTDQQSDGTDTEQGVVSDEAATTDTPSDAEEHTNSVNNHSSDTPHTEHEDEETAPTHTTPSTGEAAQMLPSTGMSDSVIIIMITLIATGYLAARKYQLR